MFFSDSTKPVALIGVKDLIVADTREGLLIAEKGTTQLVREVTPGKVPQKEVRPWGFFEILSDLKEVKTKIIHVLPGEKLSYQSHQKRDELWVMLEGVGTVTLEGEQIQLKAGESLKILRGQKHRMSNLTDKSLRFFELQTGEYFGEDDIERFEDQYGRSPAPPKA